MGFIDIIVEIFFYEGLRFYIAQSLGKKNAIKMQ